MVNQEIGIITGTEYDVNTYIIPYRGGAVVIDPGNSMQEIKAMLSAKRLKPKHVILTHGHYDHAASVAMFETSMVHAHLAEKELLSNPYHNMSFMMGKDIIIEGIKFFSGTEADFDGIKIIHTPGHTQGSVIIKIEQDVFTGDTLFCGTVGRTDLPGGDTDAMEKSLEIFKKMDRGLKMHPGHGNVFLLQEAFEINRFLR